jgi:hypothetical protein
MNNFYRRLFLYLVGVGLGFLLVYFMLINNRDRDFAKWLPERRVKENIETSKAILFSENSECLLKCINDNVEISDSLLINSINNSNINFKESNPRDTLCPEYYFENLELNKTLFNILLSTCDSTTTILKVFTAKECDC